MNPVPTNLPVLRRRLQRGKRARHLSSSFLFPRKIQRNLPKRVFVVKVSAPISRQLNRRYRKKRGPANVLSFRYGKEYGEILICPDVIKKDARKQGNSYRYQMTWMVIHAMLHLAGIHHEKSRKIAATAERLELKILHKIFGH